MHTQSLVLVFVCVVMMHSLLTTSALPGLSHSLSGIPPPQKSRSPDKAAETLQDFLKKTLEHSLQKTLAQGTQQLIEGIRRDRRELFTQIRKAKRSIDLRALDSDDPPIFLVGHSMGAGLLFWLAEKTGIETLVALCPFPKLQGEFDPRAVLERPSASKSKKKAMLITGRCKKGQPRSSCCLCCFINRGPSGHFPTGILAPPPPPPPPPPLLSRIAGSYRPQQPRILSRRRHRRPRRAGRELAKSRCRPVQDRQGPPQQL